MSLFKHGDFVLHSGDKSDFLIDCDALTDSDLHAVAARLVSRLQPFGIVYGVPEGGRRLARAFDTWATPLSFGVLIVDDVYTTGASMVQAAGAFPEAADAGDLQGAVIFARTRPFPWVRPLFTMASDP